MHFQALIPALTRGGDHYIALSNDIEANGDRYYIVMEGYYKNVWYRIQTPVQPTAEQTARFYRLMNMQKLKIARLRQ